MKAVLRRAVIAFSEMKNPAFGFAHFLQNATAVRMAAGFAHRLIRFRIMRNLHTGGNHAHNQRHYRHA